MPATKNLCLYSVSVQVFRRDKIKNALKFCEEIYAACNTNNTRTTWLVCESVVLFMMLCMDFLL